MNDEIPKRTTLPYAITYSATNNQWYMVVRKPGEQKETRFAFRTCAQMLEYYGFLLLVIADGIKTVINADKEIAAIRESDEPFITREVCGWKIEIERLPF